MAKSNRAVDPAKMEIDIGDESQMFDEEEVVQDHSDSEQFDLDSVTDEPQEEPEEETKEAKPEKEEAEGEVPPLMEPVDLSFLVAQQQQRIAELEAAQAAALSNVPAPPSPEDERIKSLSERREQVRAESVRATEEGDQAAMMKASYEAQDLDAEINELKIRKHYADNERRMQQGQRPGVQQGGLPDQATVDRLDDTFRVSRRVTPEEELAMSREWTAFVAKNPAWGQNPNNIPAAQFRWGQLDQALKLVRGKGTRRGGGGGSAMVEGGQHSIPSRSKARGSREANAIAAAGFGISPQEYASFMKNPQKNQELVRRMFRKD